MILLRTTTLVASLAIMGGVSACRKGPDVDPSWAERPLPSESITVDAEVADAGACVLRDNFSTCRHLGMGDRENRIKPNVEDLNARRELDSIRATDSSPDSMDTAVKIASHRYEQCRVRLLNADATPPEVRAPGGSPG